VQGLLGLATLGTGMERPRADRVTEMRQCRIDREAVSSAAAFCDHVRLVWLTPAMDGLFSGPAAERRRFLDRLVLAADPGHGARVNALERSLRSRNRLLEEAHPDAHWLDAIEHETAELAIAVAAARAETVGRLGRRLRARQGGDSPFPWADITLEGWIERSLPDSAASDVEDRYRAVLRENRARDAAAGRTLDGPHLSDLTVVHGPKGVTAGSASTGEQKALLIALIMAHAGLIAEMTGSAPILLLDEVVAHLDPQRRRALYDELERIGAQVWMTGADPAAFAEIRDRADIVAISPGAISRADDA
jgi:DNA replication and repair protein RecF